MQFELFSINFAQFYIDIFVDKNYKQSEKADFY